jgi:N-acetylmuramic acid 6-phosphate etherase
LNPIGRRPPLPGPEDANPASKGLDALPVADILRLMHGEDLAAVSAVGKILADVEKAVDDAISAISGGGRVFYIGAGTSGRLGVLDAAEVRPTFGSDRFRAILAGSGRAMAEAEEGAEDDEGAGMKAAGEIRAGDMALGISASGRTPFVVAALQEAKARGARSWLLTCDARAGHDFVDGTMVVSTGPELVAGSTRLKAATATKLVLNMLSTASMAKLGGVHDGLMIDVVPSNKKLVARAEGIIAQVTGCGAEEAAELLRRSGMRAKVASLMKLKGLSKEDAEGLLEKSGGSLRGALEL